MPSIGDAVRLLRAARNVSLVTLSKQTGIATPTLCLLERNRKDVSITSLQNLALALNVPFGVFISYVDSDAQYADDRVTKITQCLVEAVDNEDHLRRLLPRATPGP